MNLKKRVAVEVKERYLTRNAPTQTASSQTDSETADPPFYRSQQMAKEYFNQKILR
jgi:hypothetical protein